MNEQHNPDVRIGVSIQSILYAAARVQAGRTLRKREGERVQVRRRTEVGRRTCGGSRVIQVRR